MDCTRTFSHVQMDFDHVRGEKIENLSRLIADNHPSLTEELAKCDLVCAVCHRCRTRSRKGLLSSTDHEFVAAWVSDVPELLAV